VEQWWNDTDRGNPEILYNLIEESPFEKLVIVPAPNQDILRPLSNMKIQFRLYKSSPS
jgi:hypothetical protein